ncbi:Cyclin domain-containing protein [Cephalotus follicularis]|uniref:Cyclin n=1 Tax=Cephalotus follicularis TaxID=3775 RepID=A0A1Q3B597_CEPFO|nr:Cyclin domain-containing protein [Cephalotus follicularis]
MGTWVHDGKKATESETHSVVGLNDSYKLVLLLSSVIERSIQRSERTTFKASKRKDVVTIFHGSRPPTLTIQQYLERIIKYANCSPSCLVVAYVYIQKFLQRTDASLTHLNVHRLLITSIMVAAKVIDNNECHNNAYFAKIGGLSTEEMNKLEIKLLFSLDFRLHVTVEVFKKHCWQLQMGGVGEHNSR